MTWPFVHEAGSKHACQWTGPVERDKPFGPTGARMGFQAKG